ncbi:hypothetical protein [Mucilaginibacter xinganensis]|uniref:Uncharacterized protein n=1 Tax=Mucilaginibacter xinganensis TaxID=1234841 RepID=A0A223NUV6_9SPHI|nr:hypothetical protein [Mucilaginibacter xinganensis]ASU33540.1 hypothetical protein MuYL_1642 [Mucilaginibacter xinganensis]
MKIAQTSFRERAQQLGHSLELLDMGLSVTSTTKVQDVDQLRDVTRIFNPNYGPALTEKLFGNIPLTDAETDGSAYGTLRRVNEFLYGDAPLAASDRKRVAPSFPIQMETTSAQAYTLTGPTIISPTQPAPWGNNQNIGVLTINDGAYLSVYQTAFNLITDGLVRIGSSGSTNLADINIFGATGTYGGTGSGGSVGATGSVGTNSSCTVSGSEPGDAGGPGGTGGTGGTGGPGGPGGTGLPSYQATITINGTVTVGNNPQISIWTRSGTGGSGGVGGTGGQGGTGGNGANGANCECTGTNGGNAGNGGSGGTGGLGGNAGAATNASGNIVVNVPSAYAGLFTSASFVAPPGNYGTGGGAGSGGVAGSAGSSGKHSDGGNGGSKGATGSIGNNGNASTQSGTPATISISPF